MTLSSVSYQNSAISLLAIDELLLVISELARKAQSVAEQREIYEELATVVITELKNIASGYCLSGMYGYDHLPILDFEKGLVFSLEKKTIDVDPLSLPMFAENWSVKHSRNNYALSKLELFYHPMEKEAAAKRMMVTELAEYAHMLDTDFVLDLHVMKKNDDDELSLQLASIKHFRSVCDLLILNPGDQPMSAITISAELDIPWIYGQTTTSYPKFKKDLRISLDSGAKGCYIGQSLLSGITTGQNKSLSIETITSFIKTEVVDRVVEIDRIVQESVVGS